MNRPIKFRVWNLKRREWIYFTLDEMRFGNAAAFAAIIDQESWGKFTSLHDKNGKEIYEGDVFKPRNGTPNPCKVVWEVNLGVGLRDYNGTWQGMLVHQAIEGEVIGNIYENPELIK